MNRRHDEVDVFAYMPRKPVFVTCNTIATSLVLVAVVLGMQQLL